MPQAQPAQPVPQAANGTNGTVQLAQPELLVLLVPLALQEQGVVVLQSTDLLGLLIPLYLPMLIRLCLWGTLVRLLLFLYR